MLRFFVAAGILTLFSCSVRKAGGKMSDEDGYIYYVQPAPQMRIQLYGDYKFHSVKGRHFSDVDKSFLKYTTAMVNRTTPKLMYAAHTFVPPFYSTIGVVYKNQRVTDVLLTNMKQQLQADLKTTFNAVDSIYTSAGTALYFSYPVQHPVTGATTIHREYLIRSQHHIIRFYFWTADTDTSVIFREAETILKNIKS